MLEDSSPQYSLSSGDHMGHAGMFCPGSPGFCSGDLPAPSVWRLELGEVWAAVNAQRQDPQDSELGLGG